MKREIKSKVNETYTLKSKISRIFNISKVNYLAKNRNTSDKTIFLWSFIFIKSIFLFFINDADSSLNYSILKLCKRNLSYAFPFQAYFYYNEHDLNFHPFEIIFNLLMFPKMLFGEGIIWLVNLCYLKDENRSLFMPLPPNISINYIFFNSSYSFEEIFISKSLDLFLINLIDLLIMNLSTVKCNRLVDTALMIPMWLLISFISSLIKTSYIIGFSVFVDKFSSIKSSLTAIIVKNILLLFSNLWFPYLILLWKCLDLPTHYYFLTGNKILNLVCITFSLVLNLTFISEFFNYLYHNFWHSEKKLIDKQLKTTIII